VIIIPPSDIIMCVSKKQEFEVLSIVYFRLANNKTMMMYNVLDYIMAGQRYNKQLTMGGTR
jgi:hypothetical protein